MKINFNYFVLGRSSRRFALVCFHVERPALHSVAHPVARRNAERDRGATFDIGQSENVGLRGQRYLGVHVFRFLRIPHRRIVEVHYNKLQSRGIINPSKKYIIILQKTKQKSRKMFALE